MMSKQSKAELARQVQALQGELAKSKTPGDLRELIHTLINFLNDEIGRTLAESTDPEWCGSRNMDMLTVEQAETLTNVLSELVKQSSFVILSRA